jgi:hypothetical protein
MLHICSTKGKVSGPIARIGTHVPATPDIDVIRWTRAEPFKAIRTLDAVVDVDLSDGIEFQVGDPTSGCRLLMRVHMVPHGGCGSP